METVIMPNALRRLLVIFGALLVLSLLVSAFSAVYVTLAAPQRSTYVPTTIGFEGQLADAEGTPVADGDYAITFRLYADDDEGEPVWTEPHTDPSKLIHVADGLYSVQLGSITPFSDATFNGPRFLGVQVGSDGEMSPRIPVSAVPFALNAKSALSLQYNPVSDAAPQADDALMWNGSAWAPKAMTLSDLEPVGSNASPNDLLTNYRSGAILRWKDASTIEVSTGELMINGLIRRNKPDQPTTSGMVDVKFSPDAGGNGPNLGLDTGTAGPGLPYYIYAVSDGAENTFDLIISANNSHPLNKTNYRKLGSFKTSAGSTDVMAGSVMNEGVSSNYVPTACASRSTNQTTWDGWNTLQMNTECWDNNEIFSTTVEPTKLIIRTPGLYLIMMGGTYNDPPGGTMCNDRYAGIFVNGNAIMTPGGFCDYNWVFIENTVYPLDAGDYVQLRVYQLVGVTSTANGWLKIVRLGDKPN